MAANSFDKSLTAAPEGIANLANVEDPVEIEIEIQADPGDSEFGDSDFGDSEMGEENSPAFDANLVETLDAGVVAGILSDLDSDIENDKNSRRDWEKAYKEGLKLLGLQYEERTQPWDGACGVFHPMITEAVVRFQSETITEMFPAAGPVRTKILGEETPDKKAAAQRVEDDMNYELTEVMREFRPEQERMLWSLPATGSTFKKVYFDPSINRQVSTFIPAEDMILPYGTTDMDTCHRATHEMRKVPNEIKKLQRAGFYSDILLHDPVHESDEIKSAKDKETGFTDLNDERMIIRECHVDLYIPGAEDDEDEDQIALPYVVTYIKGTNQCLAIRRNWLEGDKFKLKRQHFVHYQYIPGFGAYGFGLFHLIGGYAKSSTSILRQLIDAGTLSNLPGGLKSRGLRIKGDDTPIAPGEFRDVDIGSGALKDNILPLPYKEPSQVLHALLQGLVEEGRRFASTADLKISDMSAQAPVGTTLAILERQLKVLTAVQSRLHYTFKQELGLLAGIIRDYTDDDYDYTPTKGSRSAKKADYDCCDIIPVSDPNAATMSQRVVQYQAVIQMAQMAPDIYNLPQLHRSMLDVLGVKNADKLVPLPEDMKPIDPVTENMCLLRGEPVRAWAYQDHKSHIMVHQMMMQDPTIAQAMGQNPKAQMIMGALQAHIAEHTGYMYRRQIEAQLGMALPPEDKELPPQIEMALSGMMAQAAQQNLQLNQQQAAQAAAMGQAKDPLVQIQQQELGLKQQDLMLKQQKIAADIQNAKDKLQLDAQKLQVHAAEKNDALHLKEQTSVAELSLQRQQMTLDAHKDNEDQNIKERATGMQVGADLHKNKMQQAFQARQNALQHEKEARQTALQHAQTAQTASDAGAQEIPE